MGRNKEKGLSYFPFDIDTFQDIKIRKLIKYQGGKAVTVYALLLCLIYKSGYYMRWDEELPFIISEQTGFEEAYIREVITCCVALGLFSKPLFDAEQVLTSRGIQARYMEIVKSFRRASKISEFNLISSEEKPVSSEEKGINAEEKGINAEETPLKERERKEKEKNSAYAEQKKAEQAQKLAAAIAATQTRKQEFYQSLVPYVERYGRETVRAFFDYWSEMNRQQTKMRFEKETTWELPHRLAYWASREKMSARQTNRQPNITRHDNTKQYTDF